MTAGHLHVPTDAGAGGPRKRRKRRGQDEEEMNALFKTTAHYFQLVAQKYLQRNSYNNIFFILIRKIFLEGGRRKAKFPNTGTGLSNARMNVSK